jgi:hypothetical protein
MALEYILMSTKSIRNKMESLINIFYKIILPILTVVLLLGVSQIIPRPMFLGSELADLGTRILLCLWLSFGYRGLPKLSSSWLTPNTQWSKGDIGRYETLYYLFLALFFGFLYTVITWWIIEVFVPIFGNFSFIIALFNGVICALPVVIQYEALKL